MRFDHGQPDAILYASAGVEEVGLAEQGRPDTLATRARWMSGVQPIVSSTLS